MIQEETLRQVNEVPQPAPPPPLAFILAEPIQARDETYTGFTVPTIVKGCAFED